MSTIISFPLEYVKKRVLRHLLKRYVSYLILGEIDENQLAVDLSNGTAEVRDVLLDVNVVNQKINEENLPFELIESHIDKIHVRIFIKEQLSIIEVYNAKITLQPTERYETATSMIESMWRSMTSSLHLAEECMMEDINETPPTAEGIKIFAEAIDLIFSKIQIKFFDSIIRFQYAPVDSPIGIGVIFNIDEICYKDEAGTDPSKEEVIDTTKTEKKVYLEHSYRSRTVRMSGVVCSTIENTTNPPPQPDISLENRSTETLNQKNEIYKARINHGHKIVFAHFLGIVEVVFRMKRKEDLEGPKVAFNLNLGSLAIFLCPRQMHLLLELIKGIYNPELNKVTPMNYGGKPNTDLDQERMESDLQYLLGLQRETSHGLQGGRWSTPPQEEELTFQTRPVDNYDIKSTASVSMDSSMSSSMISSCTDVTSRTQKKENKIDVDPTAEISHFEIHLPLLSIVLLHEEILVQSESLEYELIPSNVTQMQRTSEKFFDSINRFSNITKLTSADAVLDNAVELSHLRLVATEIHLEGDQKQTSSALSIVGAFEVNLLEVSECLYVKQKQIEKVKLISFDDLSGSTLTANHSLNLMFRHIDNNTTSTSRSSPKTEFLLTSSKCTIELDISIIDRINELLKFPRIIVHKNKTDNFHVNTHNSRNDGIIDIKANTPMLTIKLRFPKPDYRAPYEKGKMPWWLRCIHNDYLTISFVNLSFHNSINPDNCKQSYTIQNRHINVWYYPTKDSLPIHLAKAGYDTDSMQDVLCRFEIVILPEEKIDLEYIATVAQVHESMSAGVKNLYDTRRKENGPFSAKKVVHESNTPHRDAQADFRELLLPGEKHEIVNFSQETMKSSKVQVRIFLPTLSLRFTSKNQFELIYNRINNDLLLWKPSFTRVKPQMHFNCGPIDSDSHDVFISATSKTHQGSESDYDDDEDDSESESGANIFYSTYETGSVLRSSSPVVTQQSNMSTWSLSLDVHQGVVSLWTLARDSTESNNVLPGQNGEILINAEDAKLFLVSEYLGDKDLMFMCLEIYNAQLYHCDMMSTPDRLPPLRDIGSAPGERLRPTIYKSESGILVNSKSQGGNREMVTLCMKIKSSHETHHVKTVTLATGFNKATLRHRMYNGPNSWISQLIDFCNVQDYPIPGYQAKDIITELYLHFWDAAIDYRPTYLPYRAAITLANLSISSHLATVANTTLLRFIAEEGYLFLSDKCPKTSKGIYYGPVDLKRDYVCLIDLGVLEICSKTTDKINTNGPTPRMDMRISNDIINIRCCADSGLALARLIKYVASNGDLTPPDEQQTTTNSNFNSPKHQPQQLIKVENQEISNITEVQQKEIIDKIKEAVDDEPPLSSEPSTTEGASQQKLYSYHGAKLYYFPGEAHLTPDVHEVPLPQVTTELGTIPPQDTSLTNSDDEFCFIDREADSNILPTEATVSWSIKEQVRWHDDWYPRAHEKRDPLKTPLNYPHPIMIYTICDMSINWHIYGGNDFERPTPENQKKNSKKPIKTVNFSDFKLSDSVSFTNSPALGDDNKVNISKKSRRSKRDWHKEGGVNRDYDVHIILNLYKIRFVHDVYPDESEVASRNYLTIYDVEVIDRLKTSEFNKLLHLYETQWRPRRTGYSQFGVKVVFVRPDLQLKRQECAVKIYCEPLKFNIDQDTLLFIVNFAKELAGASGENVAVSASPKHNHQLPIVSVKNIEINIKKDKIETEDNLLIFMEENKSETTSLSSTPNSNSTSTTTIGDDDEEIFFRSLIVAYDIPIKLDYKGKHISMEHGPLTGLLMGLGQLNGSQFYLKEFAYKQGLLGVKKLFMQLLKIWVDDIKKSQLQTVLSGVGPINSFVILICGCRDLFWMPFDQYKKDGRILKGLHRGATSFSTSTTMAVLELTTRLIYLIQLTAETAFDMLTPGPSVRMLPKTKSRRKRYGQPKDIREGVHNAMNLIKEGMEETKDNFIEVASREHEQKGYSGAIGGVMRQVPSTVLRPLIYASEATNNVLGGIKHQLLPEARKEADDKYRKDDNEDSIL